MTHESISRQWGAGKAVFNKIDITVAREVEAAVKKNDEEKKCVSYVNSMKIV